MIPLKGRGEGGHTKTGKQKRCPAACYLLLVCCAADVDAML